VVGVALVVGGIGWFVKTYLRGRTDDAPFLLSRRDRAIAVAIGASCGFVVGLTSVGSGTFFGLAMALVYPLTARKIVGTDMLHAAALLWVAGISELLHSQVSGHAIAWLLVGSIPGVLVGSNASVRVPEKQLRLAIGSVLILSGIKLLGVPHSTYVISGVLGAGGIAIAVRLLRGRSARATATEPDLR
jgi:hypothetical protein